MEMLCKHEGDFADDLIDAGWDSFGDDTGYDFDD